MREPPPNFRPPGWDAAAAPPRYSMGKRVRVRLDATFPTGRKLEFLRARSGVIERVAGHFAGADGAKAALYRVRFALRDLWPVGPGDGYAEADTLDVELFESALEPFFDYSGDFAAEAERVGALIDAERLPTESAQEGAEAWRAVWREMSLVEATAATAPAGAQKLFALALGDQTFRERLLEDAAAACRDAGFTAATERVIAMQNSAAAHHVPINIDAGLPLAPRRMLAEAGLYTPAATQLLLHDACGQTRVSRVARAAGARVMTVGADAAAGRGAAMTGVAAGVFFMALATFFFPTMDAIAKGLMQRGYPSTMVAWARYAGQCLLVCAFFAPRIRAVARTKRIGLHLLRSTFLLGATFFFFLSLSELELADAVAVMFAAPLVVTVLAGPLLGERVGVWRWSAVAIGFCGMLLIVQPGGEAFSPYAIATVAAAVCYGLFQISTRWMSGVERTETMVFYTALVGAAALTFAVPFFWVTPTPEDAAIMIAMGVLGTGGQVALIFAMRAAQASMLTPFTYLSLIWALIYGLYFFDTIPDQQKFAGVGIVVAAGLVILWRERVRAKAAPLEQVER